MAGLRGNTAWILAGKQPTGKGSTPTIGATTTYKTGFTGGNIAPVRGIERLSETDASRDQGDAYVSSVGVEGTPEFYVRSASAGFWLSAALGTDAAPVATPTVHTITPASTLPYITVWRNISDALWERYNDCKVSGLTLSADAGSPLTAAASVVGSTTTRLTADPASAVTLENTAVYNFNNATISFANSTSSQITTTQAGQFPVSSFELGISNNVSRQQTDDVQAYDVTEGTREISLGFNLLLEDINEYRRFMYNWSGSGAADLTPSSTIYTTGATFSFQIDANNIVAFTIPKLAYQEFPIEPNVAGDPITVAVRGVANRNTPIMTATVTNSVVGAYV